MSKKRAFPKSKRKSQQPHTKRDGFSSLVFDLDQTNHAEFFHKQGQKQLLQGESRGLHLFDLATQFDSQNAPMLYEQGMALLNYGLDVQIKKYLLLANKSFKAALKLDPNYFIAWHALGRALYSLGTLCKEHHFFLESKKTYEKALSLISGSSNDTLAEFYWNYASLMEKIADHSNEVSDLHLTLEAFGTALSHSEDLPIRFWQEYGDVALKLGKHNLDTRLYLKAIHCYKQGIAKSASYYDCWHRMGVALAELYELTLDEDHFCQSNECFTNAIKLNPQTIPIWKDWAKLLNQSGKRLKDPKRLHSCIEKCHKAYSCNRKDVEILILWSEALSHLGLITDKLDLIYEGGNKAAEAEDKFSLSPDIYYAQGVNLLALANYHNELDYYYQAIEAFQEGLSLSRINHNLWFHLGHTYRIVADLEDDLPSYELAEKFFQKAIHLQAKSVYFYEYAQVLVKVSEAYDDEERLNWALSNFEQAFQLQKNAVYLKPEWLYHYANALDLKGDYADEDTYYIKALEILKRVLVLDPDFPDVHYKIAVVYSHLGELIEEKEAFHRAVSHYKLAYQKNEEHDTLLLDWSLTLINLSEMCSETEEREHLLREAEYKLTQAARLGNTEVFYHLSCLYSLLMNYERSIYYLERAEQFESLPSLDEVLEDDWLENLRQTELFRSFINHLQA